MTNLICRQSIAAGAIALGAVLTINPARVSANPTFQVAQNSPQQEILDAHNRYRAEVGVPPLTWSDSLAADAQGWANSLASLGGNTLEHDSNSRQGENLWLGTADRFSYTDMVNDWGGEGEYFRNGAFPDVSSTGYWFDVGHYTQIIWRNTTQVGCGVARAGGNDILVCRYTPRGNRPGQSVY